jgi:hypothetical protein
MRRYLLIASLAAIAFSVTAPGSQAATHRRAIAPPASGEIQDRYCLQGTGYGYPGNCEYSTFEQCHASASGQDAGCGINPMYGYARQRPSFN